MYMDSNQQNTSNDLLPDSATASFGEIVEPVKQKAVEVAQQQKDSGADQLGIFARAVHGAASELESEMPQLAGYVHEAGQRLDDAASGLRSGNVNELLDKFGTLARNQPAAVFGGAMIAGFALTRFLKASAQPVRGTESTQGGTA
jgi:hypothetical protein